jgi:hypothetical protein
MNAHAIRSLAAIMSVCTTLAILNAVALTAYPPQDGQPSEMARTAAPAAQHVVELASATTRG